MPPAKPNENPNTIAEDMHLLKSDVAEIKQAIIGNEKFGQVGLVSRLTILEGTVASIVSERAAEHNARRGALWVISAAAAFIGAMGGAVGAYVKSVVVGP